MKMKIVLNKLKKLYDTLNYITDYCNLPDKIGEHRPIWIAGGSIVDSLNNIKFRDVDIYCINKDIYDKINKRLKNNFKKYETSYCTGYSINNIFIDIIYNENNSIEELFETFDFNCCKIALTLDEIITGDTNVLYQIENKILEVDMAHINKWINRNTCNRIKKYYNKGFQFMKIEELQKIMLEITDKIHYNSFITNHSDYTNYKI